MGLTGLKIKALAGLVPSRGSRRESISFLFQLLKFACIPWLTAPSSIFKATKG